MPTRHLSDEQRQRYANFATAPSADQMAQYFHLDRSDREITDGLRGDHNRLGFALMLGSARFLGVFPGGVAVAMGILKLVPLNELMTTAERWAETIAKNSPMSIRASKQAIQKGLELSLEQAMAEQRDFPAVKAMAASQDYIEGPKAFSEKRAPKWLGK